MAAQDDVRENQLVDLFNLEREAGRVRHGIDAILKIDGETFEFELKSVTTLRGGISTVRDLGRDHIQKWRGKHWIFAFYSAAGKLNECKYVTPDDMAPWIDATWLYIEADFRMADVVPSAVSLAEMQSIIGVMPIYGLDHARKLHKNQLSKQQYMDLMDVPSGYSPERMLEIFRKRAVYLINRGSTLNNRHIPLSYLNGHPIITRDHASTLRALVRDWMSKRSV